MTVLKKPFVMSVIGGDSRQLYIAELLKDRNIDLRYYGVAAEDAENTCGTPEEAIAFTGHAVGGVCPFALPEGIPVYLDRSLRRFDTVFPAAGSSNSAVSLTPDELFSASRAADWVDVCSGWEEAAGA